MANRKFLSYQLNSLPYLIFVKSWVAPDPNSLNNNYMFSSLYYKACLNYINLLGREHNNKSSRFNIFFPILFKFFSLDDKLFVRGSKISLFKNLYINRLNVNISLNIYKIKTIAY